MSVTSPINQYSQLPLNGHLVKVDTSLKRTHGVGPCCTSVIYFISLQGGHLSGRQLEVVLRLSALEGVHYTEKEALQVPLRCHSEVFNILVSQKNPVLIENKGWKAALIWHSI